MSNSEQQPYESFAAALRKKSPDTQSTYERALKDYMSSQGFDGYDQLLADKGHDIEERIKNFIGQISNARANKIIASLRMFYAANRIIIDWDHVLLFKPAREEKEQIDRPYSMDEMLTFYKAADIREQTAALIMGTGMPRIAALNQIKIERDLVFVDKYNLYACLIYPLSQARYMTFFSPQASEHINKLKGRREKGFLFVNKRESDLPVAKSSLQSAIWEVLVKSGLRVPGEKTQRHEVQMDHGFRKFGRTALGNAGIEQQHAESLEGHGKQIVRIYDRPTAEQLLERTEYHKAIPYLTLPL